MKTTDGAADAAESVTAAVETPEPKRRGRGKVAEEKAETPATPPAEAAGPEDRPLTQEETLAELRKLRDAYSKLAANSIPKVDRAQLPKYEAKIECRVPRRTEDGVMEYVGAAFTSSADPELERLIERNIIVFPSFTVHEPTYDDLGNVTSRKCLACYACKSVHEAREKLAEYERSGRWYESRTV